MKKIRIAYFVDILEEHFDGVSNTVHQIIKRIPKDEFDVVFITPHPPKNDIGFPVYQCPYLNMYINKGYRLALPGRMKKLPEILKSFQPHIIHWTAPSLLGKYAVDYAKKHKIPITTIYHTHYPTYADYYIGWMPRSEQLADYLLEKFFFGYYHDSDAVFTPTKSMREYLIQKQVDPEKLLIWGRGVDRTRFNERNRNSEWFDGVIPKDHKKLLFVSRLVKEKETDSLIRLYRLIEEKKEKWTLIVTGTGPDRERMQKNMPNAYFTGMKKDEELAAIYASADVFVFPSVTETFGNVVLEAMASGLPVIAARAGGPTDIIQEGENGFLVEPRNAHDFFEKIALVLNDGQLWSKLRTNAIQYATGQSWQRLCSELFKKYKSLKTPGDSSSA